MAQVMNPFMSGTLLARQANEATERNQLGQLHGILSLLAQEEQRASNRELMPLKIEQMKQQGILSGLHGQLYGAQIEELRRKARESEATAAARTRFGNLMTSGSQSGEIPGGPAPLTGILAGDPTPADLARMIEMDKAGLPVKEVSIPRAGMLSAFSQAYPQHAGDALKTLFPKPAGPFANIHNTAGGYLQLRPDGTQEFVRTQPERGNEIPSGYRQTPSGGLEHIPGGPADPGRASPLGPGVHRLPNGSTVSNSQLMQQYKIENNLMDPIDLQILSRTDPARGARERDKITNAQPFQQWARQKFGIDVSGGFSPSNPAPPGPAVPRINPAQERKTLNGKSYVKINGQWYEE